MPRICAFYGISIYLYYRDHSPPHVHAIYGDSEATVAILDGAITRGHLPPRAARLVREWTLANREPLLEDWALARAGEPLRPIPPLE